MRPSGTGSPLKLRGWSLGRRMVGPRLGSVAPVLELPALSLLLGQHLVGELAYLGQAAVAGLGGSQIDASACPCRHDLDKG
jgi:hypothetical protein